eukprot:4552885-Prymnesium_polylepis.1
MEQKQERMTTSDPDTSARERTHEQGTQGDASRSRRRRAPAGGWRVGKENVPRGGFASTVVDGDGRGFW